MLGKKARTCLEPLHPAIYFDLRSYRIPIRFGPPQPERNRLVLPCAIVLQHSKLRAQTALQQKIRPSVAVEIDHRESPSVFRKIQPAHTREIEISSAPPDMEHIRLMPAPAILLPSELI